MSGDIRRCVGDGEEGDASPPPASRHRQQPELDIVRGRIDELNGLGGCTEVGLSGGAPGTLRREAVAIFFFEDGFRVDTQVSWRKHFVATLHPQGDDYHAPALCILLQLNSSFVSPAEPPAPLL